MYESLLGIMDWKSWLLFEQTDRYKLLKIILRCPKIYLRRICERVIFLPGNLHISDVSFQVLI